MFVVEHVCFAYMKTATLLTINNLAEVAETFFNSFDMKTNVILFFISSFLKVIDYSEFPKN